MKNTPVFEGLVGRSDQVTIVMEEVLRRWNGAGTMAAMELSADDATELITICAEGVASFEAASKDVTPIQKVMVGVQFTINALRQWRERGNGLREAAGN